MLETAATSGSRRFRFVQFEFPWLLGPEPGTYALRERLGEPPGHVLVLGTLGASQRRLLPGRRRPRDAPRHPPPQPVFTSRATLVDAAALDDDDTAERWLGDADLAGLADLALARLNGVLHAHRVAIADPYARDVALTQALVARVGYGDGASVAGGHWARARELPAASQSQARTLGAGRTAALRPQERLAALLAGRDAALACEELALRARADLDAGRMREAALQLRIAVDAALAELEPWREQAALAERLDGLRALRDEVGAVANAALRGGLDAKHVEIVAGVLGRVEAALRARTAAGL